MNRFILCNTVLALLLLSLAACQTENSGSGSGTDINQNQTPTQNVKLKVNETQVSIEADKNLTSKFRIEAENVRGQLPSHQPATGLPLTHYAAMLQLMSTLPQPQTQMLTIHVW